MRIQPGWQGGVSLQLSATRIGSIHLPSGQFLLSLEQRGLMVGGLMCTFLVSAGKMSRKMIFLHFEMYSMWYFLQEKSQWLFFFNY